mmetsp:Transcript_38797/g.51117  ORF Transcript_38797/g.51117 Transcript_38797/m.51117 type:complete len:533 (+) Transcript_38797:150-1748(+)
MASSEEEKISCTSCHAAEENDEDNNRNEHHCGNEPDSKTLGTKNAPFSHFEAAMRKKMTEGLQTQSNSHEISLKIEEMWKALSKEHRAIWDVGTDSPNSKRKIENVQVKEKKIKKRTRKKDPNAPRRPTPSFLYFSQIMRPRLKQHNKKVKPVEISKILGEQWQSLTPEQKRPFEEKARADKMRWQRETEEHKKHCVDQSREPNHNHENKKLHTTEENGLCSQTFVPLKGSAKQGSCQATPDLEKLSSQVSSNSNNDVSRRSQHFQVSSTQQFSNATGFSHFSSKSLFEEDGKTIVTPSVKRDLSFPLVSSTSSTKEEKTDSPKIELSQSPCPFESKKPQKDAPILSEIDSAKAHQYEAVKSSKVPPVPQHKSTLGLTTLQKQLAIVVEAELRIVETKIQKTSTSQTCTKESSKYQTFSTNSQIDQINSNQTTQNQVTTFEDTAEQRYAINQTSGYPYFQLHFLRYPFVPYNSFINSSYHLATHSSHPYPSMHTSSREGCPAMSSSNQSACFGKYADSPSYFSHYEPITSGW